MMNVNTENIVLQPYKNKEKAFASVSPQGWLPIAPGIHMEKPNGTTILQTAFSTTNISSLLYGLMSNTGMKEMPIAVDIREANDLLWKLYRAENEKRFVDIALAQTYGLTYVVLLHTQKLADDVANHNLFLSIIDHFTPETMPV
jgi:hypothetical protein